MSSLKVDSITDAAGSGSPDFPNGFTTANQGYDYSDKVADYTVTTTDNIRTIGMTTGGTDRAVDLPSAATSTGRILTIKKVDSGVGTVTIDPNASQTLDGDTTVVLTTQYEAITFQSDGSNWLILNREKPYINSTVYLEGATGHGSTNTKIRIFTTAVEEVGNDITFTQNATDGASFTINTNGVYAVTYRDGKGSGSMAMGVSVNSAELTTNIQSITAANRIDLQNTPGPNAGRLATSRYFSAGDVVRPHSDGTGDETSILVVGFRITRLS